MDAIDRHQKIALQLSGGRDSVACLYLLREHLHKITVYWLNTGDAFPETIDVIEQCKRISPNFVEVCGDSKSVREEFGMPSDVIAASHTPLGVMGAGVGFLMQDRYACCARSSMNPMHQRMLADEITLIIRGQRNSDKLKGPYKSGDIVDGVELLFPIEAWSEEQVMAHLRSHDAPISRFYELLSTTPDCMGCTAYWEDGRAAYLKKYHPETFDSYMANLKRICAAIDPALSSLIIETGD